MKLGKFTLFLSLITLFLACETEMGCTDPAAENFNSEAEEDDGSCEYNSNMTFYYDDTVCWYFYSTDPDYVSFYVGGELLHTEYENFLGTTDTTPFGDPHPDGEYIPECDDSRAINLEKTLIGSSSQSLPYTLISDEDVTVSTGTISLNAGECTVEKMYRAD